MQQIFRMVNYMHNSGVVHRDLKPENFLLQHEGPIANNLLKLVDFGFARDWRPGQVLTTKVGTPYFVSPQVLDACYDNKSDIWSCGVIMYILLVGHPPFMGKTDQELFDSIRRAHVNFSKNEWKYISEDARDVITWLLKHEPRCRYGARQALDHRWTECQAPRAPEVQLHPGLVSNIRTFQQQNKLKKAALHVLAGRLETESAAISPLRRIFTELDIDGDGLLTNEELRAGLEKMSVDGSMGEDLQGLARGMDTDGNERIDYTEFLAATIDRQSYTEENICKCVFDVFDINGDGSITQAEIRKMLSADETRSAADLVAQVDENGDGTIDFQEFMCMMSGARLEDVAVSCP
jgi:calcium-dependent protein kinase